MTHFAIRGNGPEATGPAPLRRRFFYARTGKGGPPARPLSPRPENDPLSGVTVQSALCAVSADDLQTVSPHPPAPEGRGRRESGPAARTRHTRLAWKKTDLCVSCPSVRVCCPTEQSVGGNERSGSAAVPSRQGCSALLPESAPGCRRRTDHDPTLIHKASGGRRAGNGRKKGIEPPLPDAERRAGLSIAFFRPVCYNCGRIEGRGDRICAEGSGCC